MKLKHIGGEKLGVCLLLTSLFCASGCQQSPAFTRQVPASTFSQIEPGVTRTTWLTNTFGEPVEKFPQAEHAEYWQWLYRAEKQADGWAIRFYSSGVKPDEYVKYGYAGALVKDGVLVKLSMVDPRNHFGGDWTAEGRVVAGNSTLRIVH